MMDLPEGQEWVFEMVNNILIEVLGTIAEQERATIKSRQAEGINTAKAKGVKFGRPALHSPQTGTRYIPSGRMAKSRLKSLWRKTGTKRTSFYKLVKKTAVTQLCAIKRKLYLTACKIIQILDS